MMILPIPADDENKVNLAAEVEGDLRRALVRHLDWVVREWRAALAAVEQKQQGYVPSGERNDLVGLRDFTRSAIDSLERIGQEGAGLIDHLAPDELTWHNLSAEWARDEAAGRALWGRIKGVAREELASGKTGAAAVEGYHGRPFERAAHLAIRAALADGLQPMNGMEWLLIDGMAEAWTMSLRWLGKHVHTESLD